MKILSVKSFEGPSVHAPVAVTCLVLEDAGLAGKSPGTSPGDLGPAFAERIAAVLPASTGGRKIGAGFVAWADAVAGVAIHLQRHAEFDVDYRFAGPGPRPGTAVAIFAHGEPQVGVAAGSQAVDMVRRLAASLGNGAGGEAADWDPAAERDKFDALVQSRLSLSPTLLVEASRRGIPWRFLSRRTPFLRFGHGRHQKRIKSSITDSTPVTGMWISTDKNLTNSVLADLGIPAPRQGLAATAEQAAAIAGQIGYPVVVKPHGQDMGRGVSVGVPDAAAARRAFEAAAKFGRPVIVESFIPGDDHRILVIGNKVVAVARLTPAHVVGDGIGTVTQLVEATNRDPLRGGPGYDRRRLARIQLDADTDEILARAGLRRDSVPAAGAMVYLRGNANLAGGGTSVDVTDIIHPDNCSMALRAVRALGLDVAGIDFLTTDIARSHLEIGGGICEINVLPAGRVHRLAAGPKRDVDGAMLDLLYPPGAPSRIPIAAIVGTGIGAGTAVARLVESIMARAGHTVGSASADGVRVAGQTVFARDAGTFAGSRMVLQDPDSEAAVLEIAPGDVVERGLAFDWCDVTAVLGGDGGSRAEEGMALAVVARAARNTLVLNGDDEVCRGLAAKASARRICLVGREATAGAIRAHVSGGGPAVAVTGSGNRAAIAVHDGGATTELLRLADLPSGQEPANASFAAAIAYALGIAPEVIGKGLAEAT